MYNKALPQKGPTLLREPVPLSIPSLSTFTFPEISQVTVITLLQTFPTLSHTNHQHSILVNKETFHIYLHMIIYSCCA